MAEPTSVVEKGASPFYPGQPVPVELFVGRMEQIERIVDRGIGQVAHAKPVAIYIQGQYGIGKSSIAKYALELAERDYGLHGIYVTLGGAQTLEDVSRAVLEATILSDAADPRRAESLREWLSTYVNKVQLFGITLNTEKLRSDAPDLASPFAMLRFLREVCERLRPTGVKGIFLVLDEINGITKNPDFAHFIKGFIDSNAMSPNPLPLLLMLCGVEERRREMIQKHQPVERLFDVIDIATMSRLEMQEFFARAFNSVNSMVEPTAMETLIHYSAGFPKIMHMVGDAAYWIDRDNVIGSSDATRAVLVAADEVGKKYVDQQVYRALQSSDYHSILAKIGMLAPTDMNFRKSDVEKGLTETEKKKFNNFLQKMKALHVIRSTETRGEYAFNLPMVRIYIWLNSTNEKSRWT